jgi:hypothetical protein
MPASGKDTDPTDYAETPSDDAPAESASNSSKTAFLYQSCYGKDQVR